MKAPAVMLDAMLDGHHLELPARESEEELLVGGESAFTLLYQRHQPALYRFVLQMGARPQVAEEIVHDAFLELIRRPDRFQPAQGTLRGYLLGIGRHLLYNFWRRHRSEVDWAHAGSEPDDHGRAAAELDGQRDHSRDWLWLQTALAALPWRYREAVVLCDLQEVNYADAARIMRCRPGTVASRRHRGHKLLQARLQRRRGESGV